MLLFHKKLFVFFSALLLLATPVFAETTSHVAYVSAWKGSTLAKELNDALTLAQAKAFNENKFFEFVEVSITPSWGYAYILYNLTDRMGETNASLTKVAYVSAWSGEVLADKLQDKINSLQDLALRENKEIDFFDIKLTPQWGYGYIIYEISK